jgi:hypothetical protein
MGSNATGPSVDQHRLQGRLNLANSLYGQLTAIHEGFRGPRARDAFFDDCMGELNERFFMGGLSWCVVPTPTLAERWTLREYNWHE